MSIIISLGRKSIKMRLSMSERETIFLVHDKVIGYYQY